MKIIKYAVSGCALILVLLIAGVLVLSHIATNSRNIHKYLDLVKKGDINLVKKILDEGVSPNASNSDGISLLDYASAHNHKDIVKLLLDRGAKADIQTDWGETPFMNASAGARIEIAKLLLERGANPKAVTKSGKNALMLTSQAWDGKGCRSEAMDFLLSCGLDVNATDENGNTALLWAAYGGNPTAIKWLIENKADLNIINKQNSTALDTAVEMKKPEIIELLEAAGAKSAKEIKKSGQ